MTEMNVLRPGYRPWRHLCNWAANIRMFFRSLKMAWQRITKGYCDWDIYDLQEYYTELIGTTARELLARWEEEGYGETDTVDKMCDLVDAFDSVNKKINVSTEVMETFAEIMKSHTLNINNDDNDDADNYTPEELAIIENVHEKWANVKNERSRQLHKGLTLLNEIIEELWI